MRSLPRVYLLELPSCKPSWCLSPTSASLESLLHGTLCSLFKWSPCISSLQCHYASWTLLSGPSWFRAGCGNAPLASFLLFPPQESKFLSSLGCLGEKALLHTHIHRHTRAHTHPYSSIHLFLVVPVAGGHHTWPDMAESQARSCWHSFNPLVKIKLPVTSLIF